MATDSRLLKVRHTMQTEDGSAWAHYDTDLIVIEGRYLLVLEWLGAFPAVTVEIDPRHLHELPWPGVDYLYELPIQRPPASG